MLVIYRYPHNGRIEWLRVIKKTTKTIIEGKKFSEHGNLIDKAMAGNGYHGRCENCGLALVTDLGYCSWTDTTCEILPDVIVDVNIRFVWQKSISKATRLDYDSAREYHSKLIHQQGWGLYNFQIKEL